MTHPTNLADAAPATFRAIARIAKRYHDAKRRRYGAWNERFGLHECLAATDGHVAVIWPADGIVGHLPPNSVVAPAAIDTIAPPAVRGLAPSLVSDVAEGAGAGVQLDRMIPDEPATVEIVLDSGLLAGLLEAMAAAPDRLVTIEIRDASRVVVIRDGGNAEDRSRSGIVGLIMPATR